MQIRLMYSISEFHTFTTVIKFAAGGIELLFFRGDTTNFIYRSTINSLFLSFFFFGTTANLVLGILSR